jgi:hypothetical protein
MQVEDTQIPRLIQLLKSQNVQSGDVLKHLGTKPISTARLANNLEANYKQLKGWIAKAIDIYQVRVSKTRCPWALHDILNKK